jgi:toxin HigB-1
MIAGFRCNETQCVFQGEQSAVLPPDIQKTARRKLRYLHHARTLKDLRVPPGNHLEALKGERKGRHSIRINLKWRICFVWGEDNNAYHVEIVDLSLRKKGTKMKKSNKRLDPVHPGEVLHEDFMEPLNMSCHAVAKAIGTTPTAISEICRGKRSVTAEMALKLGRLFNVSPEIWIGMQADYDLEVAREKSQTQIEARVRPLPKLAIAG